MRLGNPARAARSRQASTLGTLVLCLVVAVKLSAQADSGSAMGAMDSTDHAVATAAHEAMSGMTADDPHLRLTPVRPRTAADSARAASIVADMRRTLGRYQDVRVAEADGFHRFLNGPNPPVYHFTNWRWALDAMRRFDPARPTSLLYRRDAGGRFTLVGAMYTAPARSSLDELDHRIPLGVARWHEHVNWCLPPRGAPGRWRELRGGAPVFGPRSPIATREACDSVGGRFRPRIFGWMVHVQAFASDDPEVIWSSEHHHGGPSPALPHEEQRH